MILLKIKNKRADIPVTLLVLMTVVLCIASLVVFWSYERRAANQIAEANAFSGFNYDEKAFEFYLYNIAKEVYSENPSAENDKFIGDFKAKYMSYMANPKVPVYYSFDNLVNQIKNSVYQIKKSESVFSITIENFKFTRFYLENEYSELKSISITKNIIIEFPINSGGNKK